MVAVGALNEALRLGVQIPNELSILGFDDADVRNHTFPRMSAVCQDARRLGYEAFSALSRMVAAESKGAAKAVHEIFPTWLEINDTTGQPPTTLSKILPDGTRLNDSANV